MLTTFNADVGDISVCVVNIMVNKKMPLLNWYAKLVRKKMGIGVHAGVQENEGWLTSWLTSWLPRKVRVVSKLVSKKCAEAWAGRRPSGTAYPFLT
ncbi:MAG: hypothetical protein LBU53_10705 [Zoogloeaceae bacterium]|jgi:hypothetical protein|nr:hypothetical protein [Zoogloeaceae bacterium]